MPEPMPAPDADQIQGNILAGFNKDHQTFLFVRFGDSGDARRWLGAVSGEVATVREVQSYNGVFKLVHRRRGHASNVVQSTWMNLALTASGLDALGVTADELATFPTAFRAGLASRAANLGHIGLSDPGNWRPAFRSPEGVHAVLIVASDDPDDLDDAIDRFMVQMGAHGVVVVDRLDGAARADERGHEHFGFKDGVSQPGIRGFTPAGADPDQGDPGQDLIEPGEFVIGYPTEPGSVDSPAPTPPSQYGQPAPPPEPSTAPTGPGPVSTAGPEWTLNGSFLVIQRLAQNVAKFDSDTASQAAAAGIPTDLFRAKLVGRHKSGCPMEQVPGGPNTSTDDVGLSDPAVLLDENINNFEFQTNDANGGIVPRAAHIRKVYPRDEDPPGEANVRPHRILRRGIAFGESYRPTAAKGSGAHALAERGLLFACYQADIERQFEFIQQSWVNHPGFPVGGDGVDPILSEEIGPFAMPGAAAPNFSTGGWITMTGGEYFFQPSIDAIARLSAA